ncbi:MAG: OsmC family protein [Nevskiales bacterium]|nr:OsmC family protein [Nevskiales bacterium]
MSEQHAYRATIDWRLGEGESFVGNRYSRRHQWHFDGGVSVPASAAPGVVPVPLSDPAAVDPEEAFVAALSSCHMLFFLAYAAKQGHAVRRYLDEAVGVMGRNPQGRIAMLTVTLRPRVEWDGAAPSADAIEALHERAHHACYIANSVTTDVRIEPAPPARA